MSAAPAYVPVPMDSLVGENPLAFDLYLQLNTKHVLYLRKGGAFDGSRVDKMREKKVQNLYILAEEEGRYRDFYERKLDDAYAGQGTQPAEQRMALVTQAQVTAVEDLLRHPESVASYTTAKTGASKLTQMFLKDDEAIKSILMNREKYASVAAHGVAVAGLAVAIAKKLGLEDSKDLPLLTLGCLLHDGGLFNTDLDESMPVAEMSDAQKKIYKEHPSLGVRGAQELVHFDQHVLKVIHEHHECIDGSGFPKGQREKDMHFFSIIAATADAFEHYIRMEPDSLNSALKRFVVERIGRHPLDHINALKSVVAGCLKS